MCQIDNVDPCDFVHTERRTARKPHTCNECHRQIRPGETYEHARGKFDGSMFTNKTCAHCSVAGGWLIRECGGYCFAGVKEDLREHWDEDGIRTRELARLIWGMQRRWTKRNGELMPLPRLVEAVTG